jgi:hypothetical protein
MWVISAAPAVAGGAHQPRFHQPGVRAHDVRPSGNAGVQNGSNNGVQASAPAGMPSFYQPSYSIDRKDWWQPHPYFQPNSQGFGYPTRPVARPHAGYWVQEYQR